MGLTTTHACGDSGKSVSPRGAYEGHIEHCIEAQDLASGAYCSVDAPVAGVQCMVYKSSSRLDLFLKNCCSSFLVDFAKNLPQNGGHE